MADQALEKLKRNGEIETLLPDNAQYTNRFEIKSSSSNRLYVIAQNKNTGVWSCGCPGWIIHRKCRHLTSIAPMLENVDNKPEMKKLDAPDEKLTPAKQLAKLLNGRERGDTEMTEQEERQAKKDGLVVVTGYSDDNMEFRGAINDEFGCFDGGTALLDKKGLLPNRENIDDDDELEEYFSRKKKAQKITSVWCPKKPECSWIYKTKIPHEKFKILEDGELYCVGIVFDINNLK